MRSKVIGKRIGRKEKAKVNISIFIMTSLTANVTVIMFVHAAITTHTHYVAYCSVPFPLHTFHDFIIHNQQQEERHHLSFPSTFHLLTVSYPLLSPVLWSNVFQSFLIQATIEGIHEKEGQDQSRKDHHLLPHHFIRHSFNDYFLGTFSLMLRLFRNSPFFPKW